MSTLSPGFLKIFWKFLRVTRRNLQFPGGDPRFYRCGVCGMPQLRRILTNQQKAFAGAAAGAGIGALLGFGAPDALIGAP